MESYLTNFPDYYETGDMGFIDDDGYMFIMVRSTCVQLRVPGRLPARTCHAVFDTHAVTAVSSRIKWHGLVCLWHAAHHVPAVFLPSTCQQAFFWLSICHTSLFDACRAVWMT